MASGAEFSSWRATMGHPGNRPQPTIVIIRTLIGLLAACLIAALIWWAVASTDPTLQTANSLSGERWYQLTLADNGVGYYRSVASRSRRGEYAFRTELRFALSVEQPVTIQESYLFAATAPYPLVRASHRVSRATGEQSVSLQQTEQGLLAQRASGADTGAQPPQLLDWQFTLGDYLAFESWIREQQPSAGATVSVRSPNLDTLALASDVFELVSAGPTGYQVRKRSLLEDTLIELDRGLIPLRFELAGVFRLERSTEAQALRARTKLHKSSYRLPLNKALRRPHELVRLELKARGRSAAEFPQPLILTANPLVPASTDSYLNASHDYPVDHPRLQQALAQLDLADLAAGQQVDRLLAHVHQFVRYDASVSSRRVLDLLEQPVGDCTEFADLFTSLARAAGIPARTVIGMAYTDNPDPALAFHAWNQVQVDGDWQAVDPTWNQRQVDATHWPLPASERQAMLLLTGQVEVALEVISTDYRSPSTI